jgi:hypothetical protein
MIGEAILKALAMKSRDDPLAAKLRAAGRA